MRKKEIRHNQGQKEKKTKEKKKEEGRKDKLFVLEVVSEEVIADQLDGLLGRDEEQVDPRACSGNGSVVQSSHSSC